MTQSFRWLHLTDLHWASPRHKARWNSNKKFFFDSLEILTKGKRCGAPFDVVFFTGDLVNMGKKAEYEKLNEFLLDLWPQLNPKGMAPPLFIPIPGNHDLQRPPKNSSNKTKLMSLKTAFDQKVDAKDKIDLRNEIWAGNHKSPLFKMIQKAFANYEAWLNNLPPQIPTLPPDSIRKGLFPGEFAATFRKDQLDIGILGLNSAFLQLDGGDYEGKLAIDFEQSEKATGDLTRWIEKHHFSVVLTHHPVHWFSPKCKHKFENDIAPAGRFAVHLSGHTHSKAIVSASVGGADVKNSVSTLSLFGAELEEDPNGGVEEKRVHGYAAGLIDVDPDKQEAKMYLWAKEQETLDGSGYQFRNAKGLKCDEDSDEMGSFEVCLKKKIEPKAPSRTTDSPSPFNGQSDRNAFAREGFLSVLQAAKWNGLELELQKELAKQLNKESKSWKEAFFEIKPYRKLMEIWQSATKASLSKQKENSRSSYQTLSECMGWLILLGVRDDWNPEPREGDTPYVAMALPCDANCALEVVYSYQHKTFADLWLAHATDSMEESEANLLKMDPVRSRRAILIPKIRDAGSEKEDHIYFTRAAIYNLLTIPEWQIKFEKNRRPNADEKKKIENEDLKTALESRQKENPNLRPYVLYQRSSEEIETFRKEVAEAVATEMEIPLVEPSEKKDIWVDGLRESTILFIIRDYFIMVDNFKSKGGAAS